MAEIRALLLKHKVLFFRDQDITRAEHVAFARHFGELEDHPVAGSDPEHPGLVRIYKTPEQPQRPLRELLAHRCHLAREAAVRLRAALRRVPAGRRRHDVGQHGEAYERLPEDIKAQIAGLRARHSIEASFGAAMPIEKRLALKAQFPDAEHPVVRTHPETGEKVLFVNALHDALHQLPHARATCASARTTRPARSQLLQLPDQPGLRSRVPGPLPLEAEQRRVLGQPLHAALRGDGLPAVPSQDGARRHRRRHAVLKTVRRTAPGHNETCRGRRPDNRFAANGVVDANFRAKRELAQRRSSTKQLLEPMGRAHDENAPDVRGGTRCAAPSLLALAALFARPGRRI